MNLCPCILNGRASFLSSEGRGFAFPPGAQQHIFRGLFFVDRVWGEAHTVLAHCCFCAKGIVNCEG